MRLELNHAGHHKSHFVSLLSNYETILKRFHENHNFPIYTEVWNGQQYRKLSADQKHSNKKIVIITMKICSIKYQC